MILEALCSVTRSLNSKIATDGVGVAVGAAVGVGLDVFVGPGVFVGSGVFVGVGVSEAAAVAVTCGVSVGVSVGMFSSRSITVIRISSSSWRCITLERATARLSSVVSPAALRLGTTRTARARVKTTRIDLRIIATSLHWDQVYGQCFGGNVAVCRRVTPQAAGAKSCTLPAAATMSTCIPPRFLSESRI